MMGKEDAPRVRNSGRCCLRVREGTDGEGTGSVIGTAEGKKRETVKEKDGSVR
jgi:hypothetical protein